MLLTEYIEHLKERVAENGDAPLVYDDDTEVEVPEFQPASATDGYEAAFVLTTP